MLQYAEGARTNSGPIGGREIVPAWEETLMSQLTAAQKCSAKRAVLNTASSPAAHGSGLMAAALQEEFLQDINLKPLAPSPKEKDSENFVAEKDVCQETLWKTKSSQTSTSRWLLRKLAFALTPSRRRRRKQQPNLLEGMMIIPKQLQQMRIVIRDLFGNHDSFLNYGVKSALFAQFLRHVPRYFKLFVTKRLFCGSMNSAQFTTVEEAILAKSTVAEAIHRTAITMAKMREDVHTWMESIKTRLDISPRKPLFSSIRGSMAALVSASLSSIHALSPLASSSSATSPAAWQKQRCPYGSSCLVLAHHPAHAQDLDHGEIGSSACCIKARSNSEGIEAPSNNESWYQRRCKLASNDEVPNNRGMHIFECTILGCVSEMVHGSYQRPKKSSLHSPQGGGT
eukprot:g31496.t1